MIDLNEQCALHCEGYVRAGVAPNGTVWLHPPGERNRSVPVPAYTEDWQACMRLVQRYRLMVHAGFDAQGSSWDIATADGEGWEICRTDAEARQAIVDMAMRLERYRTALATSRP